MEAISEVLGSRQERLEPSEKSVKWEGHEVSLKKYTSEDMEKIRASAFNRGMIVAGFIAASAMSIMIKKEFVPIFGLLAGPVLLLAGIFALIPKMSPVRFTGPSLPEVSEGFDKKRGI